jgi:putative flippase GtrA
LFYRFILVGGFGFIIDLSVTSLLISFEVLSWIARIPAIVISMAFTWLANRNFTYKSKHKRNLREAINYTLVSGTIAILNYSIYLSFIKIGYSPYISIALSTFFQIFISFTLMRNFVFNKPE